MVRRRLLSFSSLLLVICLFTFMLVSVAVMPGFESFVNTAPDADDVVVMLLPTKTRGKRH